MDQEQRHVDDTCNKLLENPTDSRRFWHCRIVTGDEMWWVFDRSLNRECVDKARPPTYYGTSLQTGWFRLEGHVLCLVVEFRRDN